MNAHYWPWLSLAALAVLLAPGLAACGPAATSEPTSAPTATPLPSPTPIPEATASYAIVGVGVVDVELGIIVPDQTVIIAGEQILAVGARADLPAPSGATVIDGQGRYLMPGLVDAHVHFVDPEVFGRVLIAKGVLLVRDMGLPTEQAVRLRDALNRGELLGPEMYATGSILDGDPPLIPSIAIGLKTPEAARAAVRQQAEAGVDAIKAYSRLEPEVFLAILDEARRVGLPVMGHVSEAVPIEDAAAAGLRSSEHLFGFEKVLGRLLGERVTTTTYAGMGADVGYLARLGEVDPQALAGVYRGLRDSGLTVCPTVVVFQVGTRTQAIQGGTYEHPELISPEVFELWQTLWAGASDLPDFIWQNWAQMVRELNEAGVPLMVGTDLSVPGIIPGFALHEEMALWQAAGITPAEVLRAATLVPARFMGRDDRLGTVSAGKAASLVLLTGNPLEDVRNAEAIEAVFLRGHYFGRGDLEQLLAEAEALAGP